MMTRASEGRIATRNPPAERPSWSWLFEDDVLPQPKSTVFEALRYGFSLALLAVLTLVALFAFRSRADAPAAGPGDGNGADAPAYADQRPLETVDRDDWFRPLA
jgi:hypothetical protein